MSLNAFCPAIYVAGVTGGNGGNGTAVNIGANDGKVVRLIPNPGNTGNASLVKFGRTASGSQLSGATDTAAIFISIAPNLPYMDILVSNDIKFITVWGVGAATVIEVMRGEIV